MAQWTKEIPKEPGFYWYRDNRSHSLGEIAILELDRANEWYRFASDEGVHFGPPHPNVAHIFKGREDFNPEFWDEPLRPPQPSKALVAKDKKAAWNMQDTRAGEPHGWIQWKGTEVCMDIHCVCGDLTHVDASFAYHIECVTCGRVYFVNGHVQLIELETRPEECVVRSEG